MTSSTKFPAVMFAPLFQAFARANVKNSDSKKQRGREDENDVKHVLLPEKHSPPTKSQDDCIAFLTWPQNL